MRLDWAEVRRLFFESKTFFAILKFLSLIYSKYLYFCVFWIQWFENIPKFLRLKICFCKFWFLRNFGISCDYQSIRSLNIIQKYVNCLLFLHFKNKIVDFCTPNTEFRKNLGNAENEEFSKIWLGILELNFEFLIKNNSGILILFSILRLILCRIGCFRVCFYCKWCSIWKVVAGS